MSTKTLTQRVAELEAQLEDVKKRLPPEDSKSSSSSFVESVWGVFRADPAFDEAMKLGREYRESLRPNRTTQRKSKNARPRH